MLHTVYFNRCPKMKTNNEQKQQQQKQQLNNNHNNALKSDSSSSQNDASNNSTISKSNSVYDIFYKYYIEFALNPFYDYIFISLLLIGECILCYVIINKVSYTEIDWKAYMEEVEMWYINGEYNYRNIYGNTGPLVYPAGFLYIFVLLRYITSYGTNIKVAQYIFMIFYIILQLCVLYIYQQTINTIRYYHTYYNIRKKEKQQRENEISSSSATSTKTTTISSSNNNSNVKLNNQFFYDIWIIRIMMIIICLSKRLHSIFILRLFNDGITMLLFYISLICFIHYKWNIGCILFSLAVSIKMNILLYAPGLLLLLLQISSGDILYDVVLRILIYCATPQLLLGLPFLLTYPESYIRKSFELDRVFFYIWTVNWKVSINISIKMKNLNIIFSIFFKSHLRLKLTLRSLLVCIILFSYFHYIG